ncbi:MAG: glycosyltransferase family 2 protein [Clostridia bacterium]|nr:glycosyltransferase family 2 protein [Clostridia bacterium]
MKLSIIICVYNTPIAYLDECLQSITQSTLEPESYEICLVDDGSTVDYSTLWERYAVKYQKTENQGIFRARLLGISMAEGDYIAFVDSDDTVSVHYHRPMLTFAEMGQHDVVFNGWAFHSERSRYYCKNDTTIARDFTYCGEDILPAFLANRGREHSYYVLWNKLFSARVLRAAREQLLPIAEREGKYNFSEDALICFFAFLHAKRIRNLHTGYYFYRIHSQQTVNVISRERLASHIKYMAMTFSIMEQHLPNNAKKAECLRSLRKWKQLMARTHYSHAKGGGYTDLYPMISQCYGVPRLRPSRYRDGSVYASNWLLPKNYTEIDRALLALWHSTEPHTVSLRGCTKDTQLLLFRLMADGAPILPHDRNGLRLPRPVIRWRDRLVMHPLVYRMGLLLFPKGSRLRAILKKRI